MSLFSGDVRMAMQSIKSTKLRSFLTMMGVVIGVASVIAAVSLGEGIQRQINTNIKTGGPNVISIRPGKLVNRDNNGKIKSINYQAALSGSTLTDRDFQAIAKLPGISKATPLSTISALTGDLEGRKLDATVVGVTASFPDLAGEKITYGSFFDDNPDKQEVAVIGFKVAEKLFQQNIPLGQTLKIMDKDFIVVGIFDEFDANLFSGGGDLNEAVFIPYNAARNVSNNNVAVYQVLAESGLPNSGDSANLIKHTLTNLHGGQQDFSVLTQADSLELTGHTLNTATSFIAGIAAISLIVGGIGIMNIMFVGVTERTREIGVRKALGATNSQIYSQFLIEATIISVVGGIIGVIGGLLANYFFKVFTSLSPVATLPIIGVAVLVSVAVGIIFGTAPAIKAARKDPIQSLRHE